MYMLRPLENEQDTKLHEICNCYVVKEKKSKNTPLGVITGASRPRGSPRLRSVYTNDLYYEVAKRDKVKSLSP